MTDLANLDPLLLALVQKLPAQDEPFYSTEQEAWLAAAAAVLGLLHPPLWTQEARERVRKGLEGTAVGLREMQTVPDPPSGSRWRRVDLPAIPPEEVLSSQTTADAVDDESGGGETPSGADAAPPTSPPASADSPAVPSSTAPSMTAPTSPSSGAHAPARSRQPKGEPVRIVPPRIPPPQEGRKRHFTADQKGTILRRVVREGMPAVQADTMIHESTLNRWIREMPKSIEAFTEEWEAEQREKALAEAVPTVEELEAEKAKPVPPPAKPKPAVQWPSTPIERRPVDHERVRRGQADWA